jgi:hypothetical protein
MAGSLSFSTSELMLSNRFRVLFLLAVFALAASGCGGDAQKGVNSGKDMPKPAKSQG